MNLREAWEKSARGDRVTDEELEAMIQQMEAAMPYLTERPGYDLAVKAGIAATKQKEEEDDR